MIKPTIGRKVWFRQNYIGSVDSGKPIANLDHRQPMDATIIYVWSDVMVNLLVLDHYGNAHRATSVTLLQGNDNPLPPGAYCEWMPYQTGQAKAAA